VKQRIESARAKLVPVPCKFLDKPEAENRPFGGMVKDMKADQPSVEVLVCIVALHFCCSIQDFVIETRYICRRIVCQDAKNRWEGYLMGDRFIPGLERAEDR
jgi:hypothetical protein